MAYASLQDFRDEGVTEAWVDDVRLAELIDEACALIDRVCGWFFEPRSLVLRFDGNGSPTVELPYPLITINSLTQHGEAVEVDADHLHNEGAPVQPGFYSPFIERLEGLYWTRARKRIIVDGVWGYTIPDTAGVPDPQGRTPPDIKRATMMLVMRSLPLLSNEDEVANARGHWRIMERETRDQKVKTKPRDPGTLTGDADVDDILQHYTAPAGIEVAG